jgi:hypothetical protein
MSDEFPPRPTPAQAAEIARRQRGRNFALMAVLAFLAAIFFAMTIVKLGKF